MVQALRETFQNGAAAAFEKLWDRAKDGDEPARQALRLYVAEAIDAHCFDQLPVALQQFARNFLLNPNMPWPAD